MSTKEMICTVCPNSCHLTVEIKDDGTAGTVKGNRCNRGSAFARQEILCPQRVLTSTVIAHTGKGDRLLPVRSADAFALNLHAKAMELLRHTGVSAPVKMGDVVIPNILDSGTDIVASCNVD
ncbi:MAG: DUF1667 domain-containing protein [Oscillospiraceae bacterium]|jgi:CxxC motif-containing protein|nr:DUF1667 domain-containing protein [Oscillospiraceae bacterium]MCI1990412.1 DUF1667 domain-containing protein [Oscillospiraceae bacterium]MCI2035934.1 DUF1667 domain-containing protein [Oscillospiraceae bacterium]